jgi:polar amino acid transport system substrate-binding protein
MRRSIATFSMTLLVFLLTVSYGMAGGILERIIADKKLKVGIAPWPGFIQRDLKTKRYEGIIADDLRRFERVTGIKVELIETTWRDMIGGLNAGKYDAVMNGLGATVKRALKVAFTEPYGYYCEAALIRSDDIETRGFADLDQSGNVITCVAGTSAHGLWEGKFKRARLYPWPDAVLAIREVIKGRAKAFMSDLLVNSYRARILPEVKLFIPENTVWFYQAHAVRYSDPDLLTLLDNYVRNMKVQGWYEELGKKWNMPPQWAKGRMK